MALKDRVNKLCEAQTTVFVCPECGDLKGPINVNHYVTFQTDDLTSPKSRSESPKSKSCSTCGRGLVFTIAFDD
jgi:predicted RNA-binding Zn-ribbon protein involved in translation (DUF1610 family)